MISAFLMVCLSKNGQFFVYCLVKTSQCYPKVIAFKGEIQSSQLAEVTAQ